MVNPLHQRLPRGFANLFLMNRLVLVTFAYLAILFTKRERVREKDRDDYCQLMSYTVASQSPHLTLETPRSIFYKSIFWSLAGY